MLPEFERIQDGDKNSSWKKSLPFSTIENMSVIMPTSNKPLKMNKEQSINLEYKIDDITKGLNKEWSKNLREGLSCL